MTDDPKTVALSYIEACGRRDFDAVVPLLSPDIRFVGPGNTLAGAAPYVAVLRQIGSVWMRSDVKKVFADGPDVCVIYDFVTDTPAGAVPIMEWLRVERGRITSVTLLFDRVAFKPASDEIARRAAR
ncbi:MAG: nuclear transport factor 2 family protein [Polyangiaceae bacterium]|nr:nuclear transport factor 2 family protein [Polyangiaceae bacterium]